MHPFARLAGTVALLAALGAAGAAVAADPAPDLSAEAEAPTVSVVVPERRDLVERATITGTLVPRDEVLVAPEIDGVRVTAVLAEEGDRVAAGQVLARLSHEMLDVQIAQNEAALARAAAAIEQGRSQIEQAAASAEENRLALARAQALRLSGNATEATIEQRASASRSADGRLAAARHGLAMAEADLKLTGAQRRELDLRLARTEVRAPVDGVVSRRSARLGATASLSGEPLFRMIAHGLIELEGDVTETGLGDVGPGAPALVDVGGSSPVRGRVRVVYPEVDRATRLGKVRVALDPDPALRIGAFARGTLETAHRRGLAVPLAALLYGEHGEASVLVVDGGRVGERVVRTGLSTGELIEVRDGLSPGDVVVARAGTFLRPGDAVHVAVPAGARPVNAAAPAGSGPADAAAKL